MFDRRVAELDAKKVTLRVERDRLDAERCDGGRSTCSGRTPPALIHHS
jgi:hypothetical protein